jgi:hypothetical protein
VQFLYRQPQWQPEGRLRRRVPRTYAVAGTLVFQTSAMRLISRTGLAVTTFGLDVAVGYRLDVFAYALTMGSPLLTTGTLTTDSNGQLPNVTNALLVPGSSYRVVPIRQSDGQAGYPRTMVAS